MMINSNLTNFLTSTIFLLFAICCSGRKEVEITLTKDYIINPNWDEVNNSFDIIKMKMKDSNDSIDFKNTMPTELLQKLVQDTSYIFHANVLYNGIEYSKRKVYFNKYNGFLWWRDLHKSNSTKEIIGNLQKDTWYLLVGLSNIKTLYYVYVDSSDSLHTFKISASYWTDY